MSDNNCLFYGRHLVVFDQPLIKGMEPFHLVKSKGDQCAVVIGEVSPCIMDEPDWRKCERVRKIELEFKKK